MTLRSLQTIDGPHRGIGVDFAGEAFAGAAPTADTLAQAKGALLLIHGRYGDAKVILGFARHLDTAGWALVAPSAAGREWYPEDFQAPLSSNEPWLGSALEAIRAILVELRASGAKRLGVLGFSQGACLALEVTARNPGLVEAVFGMSGALIGPPDGARSDPPALSSLEVYLGSHEGDPRIPAEAVRRTAEHFTRLGTRTTLRLHPGSGHSIRPQDIAAVQAFLAS
jgi:phospholipase/carboxylesterase